MNFTVRLQNIYGNKQAPSRDIANHFAVVEHLRYICNGGYYDSNERWSNIHVHLCMLCFSLEILRISKEYNITGKSQRYEVIQPMSNYSRARKECTLTSISEVYIRIAHTVKCLNSQKKVLEHACPTHV